MFNTLKKLRDVECVKMKEASNALKAIKALKKSDCSEVVLAEKILLETELKYKLIVNKIRDVNYSNLKPVSKHSASITLSNFQYELKPQSSKKNKFVTYFVLAVSNGTDLQMSKIITAAEDKLLFNEQFLLADFDEDFNIEVKVYSIKLDATKPWITSFFKKKRKTCCPMFTIYYENVNTLEMQESSILSTSFTCCGELSITKDQMRDNSIFITHLPNDSCLKNEVRLSVVANLKLNFCHSGFLTLGRFSDQREEIFWERKWCVLESNLLNIYNYPQEKQNEKPPICTINLEYCMIPLEKNPKNFSRKRTFILKTGRSITLNDNNYEPLTKKQNFIMEKYFFFADTKKEFIEWTEELTSVLNCLKSWGRLILADNYYQ
ncbi:anillin [Leptinotarsa decemlineata]|uniref:anillin n=1 Tax=Leptinotarsa decemlineata TaxID=7539 RepID=UPI003D30A7B2